MDDRERTAPTRSPRSDGDDRSAAAASDATTTAPATGGDGAAAAHRAEASRLLRALPLDEYERLLPQLVPERLRLRQLLVDADQPITHVHFVREGVGSMLATEQEGGEIEVGTIGNEGLVGLPVLHGADTTPYRVMVQVEGDAWRIPADALRRILEERPVVRHLLLRYAQYFSDQLAQSVACNRLHTLEERCARWLLMTHDRVHEDTFDLTHDFLAQMLGVRRAGVTVAMGTLQHAGLVSYARGRVVVRDRARLQEASCGCYRITVASLERLLG